MSEYLSISAKVIGNATRDNRRVFMVRFDLHSPKTDFDVDFPDYKANRRMDAFISSLKAKFKHYENKKKTEGKRVFKSNFRFIWCREISPETLLEHYHLAIFLNGDAFNSIGSYNSTEGTIAARIYQSWASTLNAELRAAMNLVHFPADTPSYMIRRNSEEYLEVIEAVLKRLSYFAKIETKEWGNGKRNIGYSYK